MKNRQKIYSAHTDSQHKLKQKIEQFSRKTSFKTPEKMKKTSSRLNMTSQKYLQARLQFTQHKQTAVHKVIQCKNKRINELQSRLNESKQLVHQAINKLRASQQYHKSMQHSNYTQLLQQNILLKNKVKQLQRQKQKFQASKKDQEQINRHLKQKYQSLSKKHTQLTENYKQERKNWKRVVKNTNKLVKFVQRLPRQILQQWNEQQLNNDEIQ